MKTSARMQELLKSKIENFRGVAYRPLPTDKWTIGYGFTKGVKEGDTMTRAEADARWPTELVEYELAVTLATRGITTQNQFDALVSLCYNIGIKALETSTVIKAHLRGDYQAAARAFGLFIKSDGKIIDGLITRRAGESQLYLTPDDGEAPHPMPQTVDKEPSLVTGSKINAGTLTAGGLTGIATVTEVSNALSGLKGSVAGLGNWLVPVLLVATLVAIGYALYSRAQQRKSGQA